MEFIHDVRQQQRTDEGEQELTKEDNQGKREHTFR